MSVDPVLTDANTGASFNRYVYAINSPYKYIDPDGRNPLAILPLLGVGAVFADLAASDVPVAGGSVAKVGISAAERLVANRIAGKAGEAATKAKLGEAVIGEQVTVVTSTGQRSVADFFTSIAGTLGIVETKTGNATLSAGQKQLKADITAGVKVTPVGNNAKKADLIPGKPIEIKTHTIDKQ
jgi:hypothetical protein